MSTHSTFPVDMVEAIACALGDTSDGFSGSEIEHLLAQCQVEDIAPGVTKWKRLYAALDQAQGRTGHGEVIVTVIRQAMKPARWRGQAARFEVLRANLNEALSFYGLTFGEDGELGQVEPARTLPEAEQRANRLRRLLKDRCVHLDVLQFCRAELLQDNHFHAVLEATKSVGDKVRTLSGLTGDGANLVQKAFGNGKAGPILAINARATETDRSEQSGFVNLLIGLFGMFRNPPAHEAKIYWPVDEQDALDILSLLSLVHRKLDRTRRISPTET